MLRNIYFSDLRRPVSVPDMKKLNNQNLNSFLASINKSLEDILNFSFFKTIKMSKELNNQEVDGVLPVIMLFMARTGNTIKNIKNATIGNDGNNGCRHIHCIQRSCSVFQKELKSHIVLLEKIL